MFSKTTVLISFFLVLAVSINADILKDIRDLSQGWRDAKNKIKEFSENASKSATDKLGGWKNQIKNSLKTIRHEAKIQIEGKFKTILDQLQTIKAEAERKGKDVSPCLKDREGQLQQVPLSFIENSVNYVAAKVEEGQKIAKKSMDDVYAIIGGSTKLKNAFDDCGSSTMCILKLLPKLSKAIIKNPKDISKDVMKSIKYVISLRKAYKVILNKGSLGAVKQGVGIIKDVSECIANLPKHS